MENGMSSVRSTPKLSTATKRIPGLSSPVFRNKVNGTDDVEELQRYFKDIVRYQQERLLANPPARNSTSPMANMAHTLSLECMQRLIQDCQGFLHTLSLKEPKREMKEANGQPVKKKSNGLKR